MSLGEGLPGAGNSDFLDGDQGSQPLKEGDSALAGLCNLWIEKIRRAADYKKSVFQDDADEAMSFFKPPDGNFNFLYRGDINSSKGVSIDVSEPSIRMTLMKVAEIVEIFGPILYARNPIRQVNPREPAAIPPTIIPDPNLMNYLGQQEQMRSQHDSLKSTLIETYLNWTPNELHLKDHVSWAIDEALIKGRGCLSGGTLVYARTKDGEVSMRVRDLHRIKGEVSLWDGERWNRVVGTKEVARSDTDLKMTLRNGEEINCTADHIWPTGRGLQHADHLVVGDVLSSVRLPEPEVCLRPEFVPDEVGWFVGLYLGDGCLSKERKGRVQIAGHLDEAEMRARVGRLVEAYGGTMAIVFQEGTKKANMVISCPVLATIVREFISDGGAYEKHLLETCWKRSNVFLGNLLEGYLAADGFYHEGEDVWRLRFCDNKSLAQDLRTICARLGLRITLRRATEKNVSAEGPYRLYRGTVMMRDIKSYKNGKECGKDPREIVAIESADWRCDFFYDIALENSPHTYSLASGTLTHNCLWCGTYQPPGSRTTYVGSFFDSVDFLYIDPDCESLKDAWWIARKLSQPVWQVERRFGLKPGSLKGHHESANMQSEVDSARKEFDRQRGMSNDLMIYYEVYSRMGSGGRLSGGNKTRDDGLPLGDSSSFTKVLDPLVGDHVFLVVAPGVRYPLNLPPDVQELPITGTEGPEDGGVLIKERLAWPVPFWADGTWPVSVLDFHPVPRNAWPMSHIKPALGELRFLCWAYSFVSCKIKNTLRDVIAILKEMADQFKLTILEGADLSTVELDTNNRDIRECVQVLQFPPMNADIWRIIQAVEANFEKRVGLDEVRGQQEAQPRSAAQTQAQTQRQNIRPDDMGQKVESWMTEAARKEALAARMLLAPKDVLPILGLTQAALWAQFVMTKDLGVMRELEYRIEAGSTRKPNRDRDQQNADSAMQILLPILNGFAQSTGQLGPVNALLSFWCKSRDVPPGPFQLIPPPPIMGTPRAGGPPPPGAAPPPSNGAAQQGVPAGAR